jgi:hypothetical protein
MRFRVIVVLVVLVALFPTVFVTGCQALVHGVLTAAQSLLNQVPAHG